MSRKGGLLYLMGLLAACSAPNPVAGPLGRAKSDLGEATCGQLPAGGACAETAAASMWLSCDTGSGRVIAVNCSELGQSCQQDPTRGATCVEGAGPIPMPVPTPTPSGGGDAGMQAPPSDLGTAPVKDAGTGSPPDLASPCGATPVLGACAGNVAKICNPQTGQVSTWDCTASSRECRIGSCANGASCCKTPTSNAECLRLGPTGECAGAVARWCAADGESIVTVDCAARMKTCAVNRCTPGAYCCAP
jgi:hypothetical protein